MDLQDRVPAEKLIDARIKELGDWRGEMLGRLRELVREVDPDVRAAVTLNKTTYRAR